MRDATNEVGCARGQEAEQLSGEAAAATVGKSSVSRWDYVGTDVRSKCNLAQASADTQTLTLQGKSDWAGTTRRHARRRRVGYSFIGSWVRAPANCHFGF